MALSGKCFNDVYVNKTVGFQTINVLIRIWYNRHEVNAYLSETGSI